MNKTVEVSDEVYAQLERQAKACGITLSEAIAQMLGEVETARRQAVFEQMRAEGLLLPKKSLPPDQERRYRRIDVQGKPVSECLIEERH